MVLLIGIAIVFGALVAGLAIGGGSILVLAHAGEFILILGISLGMLVISTDVATLKSVVQKILVAFKGGPIGKDDKMEAMQMLYRFFMLARKEGLLALEDHLADIRQSSIAMEYPSLLKKTEALDFMVDTLRPIVDGRIKPENMQAMVDSEVRAMDGESAEPVHLLRLVGDSFPGIGICAAVLGIILTMGSIAEGPEVVGYKVAAALTGTFLGVFGAYGFINPLAAKIEMNNHAESRFFRMIGQSVVGFTTGQAPLMAVEMGRRTLLPSERPSADELEEILKNSGKGGK